MTMAKKETPKSVDGVVGDGIGGRAGVSRRAVVAGAAWSVPAIAMMSGSPAFAASSTLLRVSTPGNQVIASGAATVSASLKNSSGAAVSGAAVSFTGPSGASFSPVSAPTNGAGVATTQMNLGTPWAKPGSTVTVNAVSGSESTAQALIVLGSNLVAAGREYAATPAQTELVFPSPVIAAAASGAGTDTSSSSRWFLVLLQDGTVWSKGSNWYGQLGDGSTTDRWTWARVSGLSGVTQIASGFGTAYALLSDGSVKAWGAGDRGQVGDGTGLNRVSPTQVSGLTSGVTQIASSYITGYALSSNGSVRAWGANGSGQVGDGTSGTDRLVPTQVSGLTSGVTQIAAGYITGYALLSTGSLKAWGWNAYGQIGDGTSGTDRLVPTQVSGLTSGVTQIAAGVGNGYALSSGGSVKAWGWNGSNGGIGDGTTAARLVPTPVSGLTSGVTQIASGAQTGYALSSDGSVKAWGWNAYGQLGDGTTTSRLSPVSVTIPAGRVVQRLGNNSPSAPIASYVMG